MKNSYAAQKYGAINVHMHVHVHGATHEQHLHVHVYVNIMYTCTCTLYMYVADQQLDRPLFLITCTCIRRALKALNECGLIVPVMYMHDQLHVHVHVQYIPTLCMCTCMFSM